MSHEKDNVIVEKKKIPELCHAPAPEALIACLDTPCSCVS